MVHGPFDKTGIKTQGNVIMLQDNSQSGVRKLNHKQER